MPLDAFRKLLQESPDPIGIIDRNTLEFVAVNRAGVETYGYTEAEFLKLKVTDIRLESEAMIRTSLNEPVSRSIWTHRKKDGSIIKVEISVNALEYEERECVMTIIKDVTYYLELVRVRDELLLTLSHELEDAPDGARPSGPGLPGFAGG